ncbi:uncharacterized protein LOC119276556 isoform X1 [Triticum dicoccoides]|uniref:uncharacterized protein LOC119276556 isoform X1 n=1 Tax=Triticum dicoccoides TaxID=85692 RepID=UPI00188EB03C|nr:uncharacterized protein LOC119276556 isoform X1 [Triticum dicoccoides]
MESRWVIPLVVILLALQIHPVRCRQEPALSPCNSTLVIAKYPCDNTTIVCSRMESTKDQLVPWLSFTVSFVILFCPFLRIKELKANPRTDAQTFFWWFLFVGFLDYILWIWYFEECSDPHYSAYPVLLTCCFGCGIHLIFSLIATVMTWNSGDQRVRWGIILTFLVFVGGGIFHKIQRQALGWMGVALSVLSHSFRIGSTVYYAKINRCLFVASMVGSVNGFLWLIHPQLCISKEYKVRINYIMDSYGAYICLQFLRCSILSQCVPSNLLKF